MQRRARPVQPGEPAPAFSLSAINAEGSVGTDTLRGHAYLIAFFRGLHCPFCRRQILQLAAVQPQLKAGGIETLAVINTPLQRARLYFRNQPTPVTLLSDERCESHGAFGVPRIGFAEAGTGVHWPERADLAEFQAARINPTGELPAPVQPIAANDALNRLDRFQMAPEDQQIFEAYATQLVGQFLVDKTGTVRWTWIEAADGPSQVGRYPTHADLIAAARRGGLLPPG